VLVRCFIHSHHISDHPSRYKAFLLAGFHPLCAVTLAVGYALREYGSFNYLYTRPNLVTFICSQVLIYVCPYASPPAHPKPNST
jgi:hypothetical protein